MCSRGVLKQPLYNVFFWGLRVEWGGRIPQDEVADQSRKYFHLDDLKV